MLQKHLLSELFANFLKSIHKGNFKIGERPHLCNILKLSYSGNMSNYICLDGEKLHVMQNFKV